MGETLQERLPSVLAIAVIALVWLAPGDAPLDAQNRMTFPVASVDSGHVALGLALRRLTASGTFMQSPTHPDDEHNALFAMFTLGMGLRSIDLQTNRGEGGQNEIGPELFRDIGVLRTSELMSAHRIDGAEQYFTRAIDYGYSFDPDEVIEKWGRQEIVGDLVRLIRTLRPDVVLTMNIQGRGGDRAHEATTVLTREAYLAAANLAMFPDQISSGLRPWQPKKLYFTAGFGGRGSAPAAGARLTRADVSAYDPLLGRTYAEIGADAHSYHKCQGTNGLPALPGFGGGRGGGGVAAYQLVNSTLPGQMEKEEGSMFDGIDTSLPGLAQYAGPGAPAALAAGLAQITEQAQQAQRAFGAGNDAATTAPIEAGLAALRSLRAQLASIGLTRRGTRSISVSRSRNATIRARCLPRTA
jgi:LmbE family N-acetylglucosaminyl deacetylase